MNYEQKAKIASSRISGKERIGCSLCFIKKAEGLASDSENEVVIRELEKGPVETPYSAELAFVKTG